MSSSKYLSGSLLLCSLLFSLSDGEAQDALPRELMVPVGDPRDVYLPQYAEVSGVTPAAPQTSEIASFLALAPDEFWNSLDRETLETILRLIPQQPGLSALPRSAEGGGSE